MTEITNGAKNKNMEINPLTFLLNKDKVEINLQQEFGRVGIAIVNGEEPKWNYRVVLKSFSQAKKTELQDENKVIRAEKQQFRAEKPKAYARLL